MGLRPSASLLGAGQAIGPLPRNVEWLHHGAVSGIDSFREVSRIVVVGRQAPSPSAVQACAEALTGAACTRLPARQWYQRIDAVHELTDGRLVATERDGHPDSIAEAFRRRITGLELQQIIGGGRGLWRYLRILAAIDSLGRVAIGS